MLKSLLGCRIDICKGRRAIRILIGSRQGAYSTFEYAQAVNLNALDVYT